MRLSLLCNLHDFPKYGYGSTLPSISLGCSSLNWVLLHLFYLSWFNSLFFFPLSSWSIIYINQFKNIHYIIEIYWELMFSFIVFRMMKSCKTLTQGGLNMSTWSLVLSRRAPMASRSPLKLAFLVTFSAGRGRMSTLSLRWRSVHFFYYYYFFHKMCRDTTRNSGFMVLNSNSVAEILYT